MLSDEEKRILSYTGLAGLAEDRAFWDREEELLSGAILLLLLRIARDAVDRYADVFFEEYAFGMELSPLQAEAANWARRYSAQLVKGITKKTRESLRGNIAAWIDSGSTDVSDLAELIEPTFGDTRALRIAQTEVTRAWSEGRNMLWRESGLVKRKRWVTMLDERVCPVCGALHGKITTLGSHYPGFPEIYKPPDPHPGCRCWEEPEVQGEFLMKVRMAEKTFDVVTEKGGPGSGHWGHASRPGIRGGSVPGRLQSLGRVNPEYFTIGPGRHLIEDIPEELRPEIIRTLVATEVTPRHLAGLKKISAEAPSECPSWLIPAEVSPTGKEFRAIGAFDPSKEIVYLNLPEAGGGLTLKHSLGHEFGHHVTMRSDWRAQKVGGQSRQQWLSDGFDRARELKTSRHKLEALGLRMYSVSNPDEFAADCWKIHHMGLASQRVRLAEFLGIELDGLFGGI